jgi:hypothetical protein
VARADPWSAVALLAGALLARASFEVTETSTRPGEGARRAAQAAGPEPTSRPVDTWTPRELRTLPGIGPVRARGIAQARWEVGLEGGPESWTGVRGIGPATVDAARRALDEWGPLGVRGAGETAGERPAPGDVPRRQSASGADPGARAAAPGASPR